jgi:SsrA-binding protein
LNTPPKKPGLEPFVVARNRRASHDFHLEETVECGIVLGGSEVKSVRQGKVSLDEAWGSLDDGELWLNDCNISEYAAASWTGHTPKQKRKLLVHKRELAKLEQRVEQKGKTLVPLKVYFNERGFAKLTLAVASGKKQFDKREDIKSREAKREIDRSMKRR